MEIILGLIILLLFFLISILSPIVWIFSKNRQLSKIGRVITIIIFLVISFVFVFNLINTKMELEKNDIYGDYIINRNKCAGKQADWQYNHYRFKITEDNKIFLYITEKDKIIKTIVGTIEIDEYFASPHLKINFNEPRFHIIKDNPTLYREIWTFYYVFHTEKFDNMFFTKGNWKSIDN